MDEPAARQFLNPAFLWPALVAASASEMAALIAKQFADLAAGTEEPSSARPPKWATLNTIALELKTVHLRDFTTAPEGPVTLFCAPFALHGATVADFAPGHSLVGALRDAGLQRIFVTDWQSANADMRFLTIDDYLADLNVLVDQVGGPVDLVGLCQGGWMALLYAARFPVKVRKLVLAGAPIDIAAEPSGLSRLTDATPLAVFCELVNAGNGRVLGHQMLKFWGPETLDVSNIRQLLQTSEPIGSPAFAQLETAFRDWYAWTVNLPGSYYLEVVEKIYKSNELATGRFVALGQRIDLASVRIPIFLLAARDDELVSPKQLFGTQRLVGTPGQDIRKETAPCSHLGLFLGKTILSEAWPRIARWLIEPKIA